MSIVTDTFKRNLFDAELAGSAAGMGLLDGMEQFRDEGLTQDTPGRNTLFAAMTLFIEANTALNEAQDAYLHYLEHKAQFTDIDALGDAKLSELRAAYVETGRAALLDAHIDVREAVASIVGDVTPYVAALETTVASLRADAARDVPVTQGDYRVDL